VPRNLQEPTIAVATRSRRALRSRRVEPEPGLSDLDRALRSLPEAVWLYALAMVPSLFTLAHTRNFDLVKTVYLRGAGVLLLVAAGVALVAAGARPTGQQGWLAGRWRELGPLQRASVLAAAASVAALTAATVGSLVPRISLVGSHIRNFGLFTEAIHLLLFLAVAFLLRTPRQLSRLLDTIVTTALVGGLYTVLQFTGPDPLVGALSERGSTIGGFTGNPLFFGGLLVVAVCVAAGRLAAALGRPGEQGDADLRGFEAAVGAVFGLAALYLLFYLGVYNVLPWWIMPAAPLVWIVPVAASNRSTPRWWRRRHDAIAYAGFLALFCALVLRTDSRTHWVALAVALATLGVVIGRRRLLRNVAIGLSGAVLALSLLVLGNGMGLAPVVALRDVPGVGSVLSLAGRRASVEGRFEIWREVLTLVGSTGLAPLEPDRQVGEIRRLIGFGPGVLYAVSDRFLTPERLRVETGRVDRAHNELLERLSSAGALGLATWVAFLGTIAALLLRQVRAANTPNRVWPVGAMVGVFAGQLVSDSFGPGDPTTRLYIWIAAGVIASAAMARVSGQDGAPDPPAAPRPDGEPGKALASGLRGLPGGPIALTAGAIALAGLAAHPLETLQSFLWYYVASAAAVVVGLVLFATWLGRSTWPSDRAGWQLGGSVNALLLGVLLVGGTAAVWRVTRPLEADLYNRAAVQALTAQAPVSAVELARRSIGISPNEELYYMTLGTALAEIGQVVPVRPSTLPQGSALQHALTLPSARMSQLSRRDFYLLAEAALGQAIRLNPYDRPHRNNMETLRRLQAESAAGAEGR
jgi:O-antigen ligase